MMTDLVGNGRIVDQNVQPIISIFDEFGELIDALLAVNIELVKLHPNTLVLEILARFPAELGIASFNQNSNSI